MYETGIRFHKALQDSLHELFHTLVLETISWNPNLIGNLGFPSAEFKSAIAPSRWFFPAVALEEDPSAQDGETE
jgi:hypothetical protein